MDNVKFIQVQQPVQIKAIADVAVNIWHATFDPILPAGQVEYMIDKFQSEHAIADQIANHGYVYYQIQVNHTVCGFFGIQINDGKLFLSKLYIATDMHGKGLASIAMQKIKAIGTLANLPAVWLTVNRHNDHAIAVYRHLGFAIAREQKADIGHGYVMDDYIMEMPL